MNLINPTFINANLSRDILNERVNQSTTVVCQSL